MATRIEKYRAYREEIAGLKEPAPLTRSEKALAAARLAEKKTERSERAYGTTISLSYDDLIKACQVYDDKEHKALTPAVIMRQKERRRRVILGVLILLVSIALIVTGVILFGG